MCWTLTTTFDAITVAILCRTTQHITELFTDKEMTVASVQLVVSYLCRLQPMHSHSKHSQRHIHNLTFFFQAHFHISLYCWQNRSSMTSFISSFNQNLYDFWPFHAIIDSKFSLPIFFSIIINKFHPIFFILIWSVEKEVEFTKRFHTLASALRPNMS